MKVCTLASSSKGNCVCIFDENTKILIDCGIPLIDLENKLRLLKIDPHDINGILITHEHSDHIKSVGTISRKYNIPIYSHVDGIEKLTAKIGHIKSNMLFCFNDVPFKVGEFIINPFKLPHDAISCLGFNIFFQDKKVSIATDLGYADDEIVSKLYDSRIVILEANHDEQRLLDNPHYSWFLKRRILSDKGHLSNKSSAEVISKLAHHNVKQILLAHLSEENNTPEICYQTICQSLKKNGVIVGENIQIDIASPYNISPVFVLK